MSVPIARAGRWSGARETLPPPPQREHVTSQSQSTSARHRRHDAPTRRGFTVPPPSQGPVVPGIVRSLLPADAAQDSEPQKHPVAGFEADDPRTEVIEQGYQVRDIDRQVNALVDQQIDIERAQGQQLGQRLRQVAVQRQAGGIGVGDGRRTRVCIRCAEIRNSYLIRPVNILLMHNLWARSRRPGERKDRSLRAQESKRDIPRTPRKAARPTRWSMSFRRRRSVELPCLRAVSRAQPKVVYQLFCKDRSSL